MRKLNEEKLGKLPTFNQQLNDECGRQGTPARDEFHEEALSWYYGQILRSRRQELRMTQKQLADKLAALPFSYQPGANFGHHLGGLIDSRRCQQFGHQLGDQLALRRII